MQKIQITLTILIFLILFFASLSLVTNLLASSVPHIGQIQNLIPPTSPVI